MATRASIAVEAKFAELVSSRNLVPSSALSYGAMKGIKGCDQCFSYRAGPHHAYDLIKGTAISLPLHPEHYRMKHRMVNNTSSLWLSVICAKLNGGNKKVIRSHMVRRVRTAVTEALRKRGYDMSGKRLSTGAETGSWRGDLFGTMLISPKEMALTADFDVLRTQAELAVGTMVEMLSRKPKANLTRQNVAIPNNRPNIERFQMGNANRSEWGKAVDQQKRKHNFWRNKVFSGSGINDKFKLKGEGSYSRKQF